MQNEFTLLTEAFCDFFSFSNIAINNDQKFIVCLNEIAKLPILNESFTPASPIECLTSNPEKAFEILSSKRDIRQIYNKSDILQKRDFVNMVFDDNLYYEQGIYRTPTMMDILSHSASKMEEKGYLIYQKKRDNISVIPQSGR